MPTFLTQSFLASEDPVDIAKQLLGKVLCSRIDGQLTTGMIVETEAYQAPLDKASHAYNNKRTKRTETMFGQPGTAYVYLIYGMYELFNIVTGPEGVPHAILIRAIQPIEGLPLMQRRRKLDRPSYRLTAGPGILTQAMGITRLHNGMDLLSSDRDIWLEDRRLVALQDKDIIASPRVGVGYAEECAAWPWRFRIKDNPWSSPAK